MNVAAPQSKCPAGFVSSLKHKLAPGTLFRENEPLSRRTTMRVGGPADLFIEPQSESDLALLLESASSEFIPVFVIGRGSNLLVRDGGIRGVVVSLSHESFSRIQIAGEHLECGAGARLRSIAFEAKKAGLTGLEFMEGIPGNLGGGLRMNAGAMGSSVFEVVESLRYMDLSGGLHHQLATEISVEYRNCPLFADHIALGAILMGKTAPRETIERRMNECSQKRWNSQPAAPSAGCIFKNSVTIPSGKLVQELGLKGARVGGAAISDAHGNFIVNEGGATASDILALIDLVKEKALAARAIELRTEVQIVGEDLP
jgi:UDP-N-acetylenolpyruvoylglucosamine reductase